MKLCKRGHSTNESNSVGAFDDKVVLVTGSSSGIGESVARAFASAGATVVVNSASSVAAGQALADSLPKASYVQANVADEEDAAGLIATTLRNHGHLDVLVNNAGVTQVIPHPDVRAADLSVWRRIFDVNVFGTWAVTVAAVDALRETRGAIVNVSSVTGLRPIGSSIPYACSKAAVNHQTVLLAKALGPEVRVNAVAPGLVDTPWTADMVEMRRFVGEVAPLRRSGATDEVAAMILALAAAPYVTGQVVAVDGGLSIAV